MSNIRIYGVTVAVPDRTTFRGKQYRARPSNHSTSKSVILKSIKARRKLGRPGIVKAIKVPRSRNRGPFTVYVGYVRSSKESLF